MKANLLKINPLNPEIRKIKMVVDCLVNGGIVIYPTDTIYGLGCDFKNKKALGRICRFKGIKTDNLKLSLICKDLSDISLYARVDKQIFRTMNRCLPGPYTFILESSSNIPKILSKNKKEIGIRIPDNNIVSLICQNLDRPLINTSIKNNDDIVNYYTDPLDIFDAYKGEVDLIIDGGIGSNRPSTIIDCLGEELKVIREGLGDFID